MINGNPTVSVIIPTHNRNAALRRALDALRGQTYPPELIDVLVVADGCNDGTVQTVTHYPSPFTLRVIAQPCEGPAAARNRGAADARGRLLVFLDDDIEAAPHLLEAHVRAHGSLSGQVVLGPYPPVLDKHNGLLQIALRCWWENMFHRMRQPGHRYTYRDLLSGNFSVEADLFRRVGGFDPALWCHEDYELGLRLLKADADFTFAPVAVGHHHEKSDLTRVLHRKHQEGRADVMIGRRHPELRPVLPLGSLPPRRRSLRYLLRSSAFACPSIGDALAAHLVRMLDLLEGLRRRQQWSRLLDHLLSYWYWRGVASELGTQQALVHFLQAQLPDDGNNIREIELDLSEGLEAAESRLDAERPMSACIRLGRQHVGRIPAVPGAERLRGSHLRRILATELARPLLIAVALAHAREAEGVFAIADVSPPSRASVRSTTDGIEMKTRSGVEMCV